MNFERLLEKPVGIGILLYRFLSFFFIGVSLPLGSLGGNHLGNGFIGLGISVIDLGVTRSYFFWSRSYSSRLVLRDYLAWTCLLLLHSRYTQFNHIGHLPCTLLYQVNFLLRKFLCPSFYKTGLSRVLTNFLKLFFSDCSDHHCSLADRFVLDFLTHHLSFF